MKATNGVLLALLIASATHLLFAKAVETCPARLTAADGKGPFYLPNVPPTGLLAPVSQLYCLWAELAMVTTAFHSRKCESKPGMQEIQTTKGNYIPSASPTMIIEAL